MALSLPGRLVRPRLDTADAVAWRADAVAGGVIGGVALALSWPLLRARDLTTGGGDWPAQAYRVRAVLEHGFASWSHDWAGGMPLWEGYQALPHLVTAGAVRVTGAPVERTMVVIVALLLVALRVGVYAAARWLGAPATAALVGALLAAALDTAWQPTANFTELWGLALAPYALAAGFRWADRPGGYIVAALVGLSVEVHPLLAVVNGIGLAAGYLATPRGRSLAMLGGQACVAAAGAAVFWLPVLTSARPSYTEPYFTSVGFARLLYELATAGFLPGWWAIAGAAVVAALAGLRSARARALRFMLLCGAAVAALVAISLAPAAPDLAREGQLARLVGLTPALVGLATAVLLGIGTGRRRGWVAPGLVGVCAVVALAHGLANGPAVRANDAGPTDPFTAAWRAGVAAPEGRVYADPVVTAEASRWAGGRVRFAGSYSGREWSIAHGPLEFFLGGRGTPANLGAYLVVHDVEQVLVRAGARPAIADPATGEAATWTVVHGDGEFELLAAPWRPPTAWLLPAAEQEAVTAPDAAFGDVASAYTRDEAARRFAAQSLAGDTIRGEAEFPDGGTIVVRVTAPAGAYVLVVNENWDRTWRAEEDGRRLALRRVGLNQIGVELDGRAGDVTVRLTHGRPGTATAGIALSLLALPAGVILAIATAKRTGKGAHG